ncbi:unnamed protein product [Dicrocoelium dendriticum]|nr:unnamed protein product [Dicrocoelium dendriticum]
MTAVGVSGGGSVHLSAFEHFIYSFLSYPLHPKRKSRLNLHDFERSVYTALFTDHLNYYLYIDPVSFKSLLSRIHFVGANPQTAIFQRNYFTEYHPQCLPDTFSFQHLPQDQNILWYTEAFLQAIFEFLLCWRSTDSPEVLDGTGRVVTYPHYQASIIPQSHAELYALLSFTPTSCHLFLVRCFLKHFYYMAFRHGLPAPFQTPYEQLLHNKLTAYCRFIGNAICSMPVGSTVPVLYFNLMLQLRHLLVFCFQHWPLDLSFEIVIETWLTSIQPWRYAESPQPHGISPLSSQASGPNPVYATPGEPSDTEFRSWVSFAAAQYSLYVAPLLVFLQRAIGIDLRVCRNAHMVYRVAKILSQPSMKLMLHNAEDIVLQQLSGSGCSPYKESIDVPPPNPQSGLWGPDFESVVRETLSVLSTTLNEVRERAAQRSSTNEHATVWNRFTSLITDFLLGDEDNERCLLRKCENYLKEAICMLADFFAIPQVDTFSSTPTRVLKPPSGRLQWDDSVGSPLIPVQKNPIETGVRTPQRRVQFALTDQGASTVSSLSDGRSHSLCRRIRGESNFSPDSILTDQGKKLLTPLGKFQILMGLYRPKISYSGDREFLPPCTYEVPALVDTFRFLSSLINKKMHSRFLQWCTTPGFNGWIARRLLLSPSATEVEPHWSQSKFHPHNSDPSTTEKINPRISLRWLASYSTLGRVSLLYLSFVLLTGVRSPWIFCLFLTVAYSVYQLLRLSSLFFTDLYHGRKIF